MKITYGNFSILFTGDIEKEAERFLVNQREGDDLPRLIHCDPSTGWVPSAQPSLRRRGKGWLKSTIIKVPHHGSNSSSIEEFIRAVSPEVAVFSVGHNNPFRHPSKKVLSRYRDKGVKIYRTDRDGMIEIESDGMVYAVKKYEQRR
jgi:competence protein ComEC